MKRTTAKRSDAPMKFFTPELYLRFNSADEKVANRADAEWERAISAYRSHIDGLTLPESVRELAALNLHDAELLTVHPEAIALPTSLSELRRAVTILSVQKDEKIVSLIYWLSKTENREIPAGEDWPFSRKRVSWLYDEIDLTDSPEASYIHRILFSDGRILEIPFVSVIVHRISRAAENRPESKSA